MLNFFFLGQKIFQIHKSKQVSSKIKFNTNRVLFKSWVLMESERRSEAVGIAWLMQEIFCSRIYTQSEDASSPGWALAFLGYEKKGLVSSLKWNEPVPISVPLLIRSYPCSYQTSWLHTLLCVLLTATLRFLQVISLRCALLCLFLAPAASICLDSIVELPWLANTVCEVFSKLLYPPVTNDK